MLKSYIYTGMYSAVYSIFVSFLFCSLRLLPFSTVTLDKLITGFTHGLTNQAI